MKTLVLTASLLAGALAPTVGFAQGGQGITEEENETIERGLAIQAFKADEAVKQRLGTLTGKEEFDAILLSTGGELPHGTMTPIHFKSYLIVVRVPERTPHGFYQSNVFGRVTFTNGAVSSVELLELSRPE